jgi:transcriptional regulator, ArsR family
MNAETVRFALFAEVFAALAHPKRLEMIHYLGERQHTAGELTELTGLSKANVSQHLNVLKARGLVHCDKCGTSVITASPAPMCWRPVRSCGS